MDEYMMFKQSIRGFDKDEVLAYIHKQEADFNRQITQLEKDMRKRDKLISELKSRVVLKDEQVERLEQDIKVKYQKYIDNYRQIGELVYESRIKGDQIVADAEAEAKAILEAADKEARQRVASVQSEIDTKLNDGRKKYLAVQEEMNEIVDLFNQIQKKFMVSYKEVHEIIQDMPVSLNEIPLPGDAEDEFEETAEAAEYDDYDDLDEMDDAELEALLNFEIGELDDPDDVDESDAKTAAEEAYHREMGPETVNSESARSEEKAENAEKPVKADEVSVGQKADA